MTPNRFLPYGQQLIESDDEEAVLNALRSGMLTQGPAVARFEQALEERLNAPQAVACSNGTAALHLAVLAAGLTPGDSAVVPTMTFLATANAVRYVGADVIFADVDPQTGLMTAEHLEDALARTASTGQKPVRAVLPVHLNGQCVDLDAIGDVARREGLKVIDDASHAIGASYIRADGSQVSVGSGETSDFTTFSFHPVKTIAMGEGGAITTADQSGAERMRRLRSHAMDRNPDHFTNQDQAQTADGRTNPWYYEMSEVGMNYRASDIHCALGHSQLQKLDGFVDKRARLARLYDEAFALLPAQIRPVERVSHCRAAWHLYPVLIDFDRLQTDRARIMEALKERGIGTQVHYIPVHQQPYYIALYGELELSGAQSYYERVLSLPLFVSMEAEDVEYVVRSLKDILNV